MAKTSGGFSLPELLVTLCVVSLLLGVGVPSWRQLLEDSEVSAMAGGYLHAFNSARFRAVSEHRRIAICSLGQDKACTGDWSGRFEVFYDDDNDGRLTDASELLESVQLPDPQSLSVTFRAFARTTHVALRPDGSYRQNGTFRICPRHGGRGRAIVINVIGRARSQDIECLPA